MHFPSERPINGRGRKIGCYCGCSSPQWEPPRSALNRPRPARKLAPTCSREQIANRQTPLECLGASLRTSTLCPQVLEECSLTPSGSIILSGTRVGISPEADNHLWSITTEGFICYSPAPNLVLDVKGESRITSN